MTQFAYGDTNPAGSVFVEAINWVEAVLLGPVAFAISVVGIALVGFLMLQGRIDWRRGATVCVGCFLVFGSRSVVLPILNIAQPVQPPLATPPELPPAPAPSPVIYDPYAGASLPG